jgi:hypothetical protein
VTDSKYSPRTNTAAIPMPTDQSYSGITAFISAVNEIDRKIAMRDGINWLAAKRGEPFKMIGESDAKYLTRVLNLTRLTG